MLVDLFSMVMAFLLSSLIHLFYSFQRMGAVFPQRSESSAPVFTPPQTQPLTSYPQNLRNKEEAESSAEPTEFPTLRCTLFFGPKEDNTENGLRYNYVCM